MLIPEAAQVALATAVQEASTSRERAAALEAYAREWNVSPSTARRHSGFRKSAPTPAVPTIDPVLDTVVGFWLGSATEKYRHATMPLADTIDMCETAELIPRGVVTLARLRRYIAEHRVTLRDQRRGAPYVPLKSEHPNHAHQVDISRCRQWYLRPDGSLDAQRFSQGTAAYVNRDLDPSRGIHLFRYVCIDHTTGAFFVRYLTDETVVSLITFLAAAWFQKRRQPETGVDGATRWVPAPFEPELARHDAWAALPEDRNYPFRGVPRMLVLDRAKPNQSQFTKALCRRLGIHLIIAQEARAKGTVEGQMWQWERSFEARLAHQPATNLDELNAFALDFAAYWCRKRIHTRHGMTRIQAWAAIQPEQLREITDWRRFQEAARRDPERREIYSSTPGNGRIKHDGREWRLADASYIGQSVDVSYSAFAPDQLVAVTDDGRVFALEEIRRDRWGFPEGARTIGIEHARHPDSATQEVQKRAEAVRAVIGMPRVFGREGDKTDVPALLGPRRGVEVALVSTIDTRELTARQFDGRALARLREYSEAEAAERRARFNGRTTVPEAELAPFIAWCEEHRAAAVVAAAAVGGSPMRLVR